MPMLRVTTLAAILAAATVGIPAGASEAAIPDPGSNFAPSQSCTSAAVCLEQAVSYLDRARARLGQPPYRLPGNFPQLAPDEQAFVLTNLDRRLYGLAPITGLTGQLDQAAAAAVRSDSDPVITSPTILAFGSNWGGGYRNIVFAYGAWMYDDGPGGANLDCARAGSSGCWGHRHNILSPFAGSGPLAMGAAAGADLHRSPSDAVLLVQGMGSFRPAYAYTWSQAVAAGAGVAARAPSTASPRPDVRITGLRVSGRSISFRLIAPTGTPTACALIRVGGRRENYRRCGSVVVYRQVRRGTYQLRVRAPGALLNRYVRVR